MRVLGLISALGMVVSGDAFGGTKSGKCPIALTTEKITCGNISYHINVPDHPCVSTKSCGVIFNIHGAATTKEQHDAWTAMGTRAGKEGYIVITPEAATRDHFSAIGWPAMPSWVPSEDYDALEEFIRQAVQSLPVDQKKVHVMGFSQGGYTTYSMLCRASDIICSAAPLGAASNNGWFDAMGGVLTPKFKEFDAGTCFDASGPVVKRPILVTAGNKDYITAVGRVDSTVDTIKTVYDLQSPGQAVSSGAGTTRTRWTNQNGDVLEYLKYDYAVPPPAEGGMDLSGHCYPTSNEECESVNANAAALGAQPTACCGEVSYPQEALEFFIANPCS